jgi:hypothetical protein
MDGSVAAPHPPTRQEAAAELLKRRRAKESLYSFLCDAWPQFEGGRPFTGGWAIGAIAEHLQAVIQGEIRDLVINQPPRTTKSSLAGVCLTPWSWIHYPELQFFYTSYSDKLSIRDHVKARRLIESDWYQARWGESFDLSIDQNTKIRYDNTKGGYRVASSTDGTTTGEGGDIIVCLPFEVMIHTTIGTIPIGEIVCDQILCEIVSFNHDAGVREAKPIEAYETNPGRELVEIDLGDRVLRCTEDHQIYVEGRGYIRAIDLQPGDIVSIMS